MVCKDELCTWFRSLNAHTRIDYMCGLLLVCHPLELRFIGSTVEDLGKKDFNCLREFESKANSQQELSKSNCENNCLTRETMALNLALLHSSNTTCANVVFNFLESNLKLAFTVTNDLDNIRYILLVFTMAMYHPAFNHYQRTRMYECFQNAEKKYAELLAKVDSEEKSTMSFFNEENRENGLSPSMSQSTSSASNFSLQRVFVNSIELKDTIKTDQGHKCRLEVTWSNGEVTETYKTYTELQNFVSRLKKIFPEEASSVKENTLSHGAVQTGCKMNKMDAELESIARYLPKLPQHMMECENLNQFFSIGEPSSPPPTNRPKKCPSVDDETVISYSPAMSLTVYNSQLAHGGADLHHTKTSSTVPPVTVTAPTHRHPCPIRNSTPHMSSPCLTPTVSPVISRSSSPNFQISDPTAQIQKPLRRDYSAQVLPFGQENGERAGISTFQMGLEPIAWEKVGNVPNGIVNPVHDGVMSNGVAWQALPPNSTFHQTPAHHNQPLVFPVPYNYQYRPVAPNYTPNEPAQNSPSTGSDTSSQSPSPVSHTKHQLPQTASSSEELDKDHVYKSVGGKVGESKKKGSQSQSSNHSFKTIPNTSVVNRAVHDKMSVKSDGIPVTGSGFISDPTPTGFSPRPTGINKIHCKVQPAQTQTRICDDGQYHMKVPAQLLPIGFAQPFTKTHASISAHCNSTAYSLASSSESHHRSAIYSMGSSQCTRSQSPVMNGTNRLPICTVTTATSVNISTGANQLTQHVIPASKTVQSILPTAGSVQESGVVDKCVQACPLIRNGSPASVSAATTHSTSSYGQTSPNPSVNRATCSPLCSCCGNHANTEHSYPNMVSAPFQNLFWPPNAVITPGSNGLIQTPMPHNVQYRHTFPPNFPNGISPELLYPNQPPNYRILQQGQTPLPLTGIIFGYNPYSQTYQTMNSMNKPKKMYCHNCGSSKHQAEVCSENSMESVSGNYNINFKPDSD